MKKAADSLKSVAFCVLLVYRFRAFFLILLLVGVTRTTNDPSVSYLAHGVYELLLLDRVRLFQLIHDEAQCGLMDV
jgi:hypothetical protein